MAWALALLYVGICLFEAPAMLKQRQWKELAVFSFLLLVGAVYSFGLVLEWPVPNPNSIAKAVFGPAAEALHSLFE